MKFKLFAVLILVVSLVAGCQIIDNFVLDVKEIAKGLSGTIQTYDEESNIIDRVTGNSIAFQANSEFMKSNSDGSFTGTVLEATVGGKRMIHIGSTLLFYEDGVENIFEEYAQTVDVENHDRAIPFINQMVNQLESKFLGMDQVILIRSQSGKPLATFAGDHVSVESMEVDKMSKITIDKKRIYIYRADYTIYETSLLQ